MDHPVHGDLPHLSRRRGASRRSLRGGLAAGFLLLALFAAGLWLRRIADRPGRELPRLGAFPGFSLPDASGRTVRKADLAGEIWFAELLPKGCPSCALRNLRMTDLQTSLEKARRVVLVTFVGEPGLARPEALSELAREYGARPGRWLFLAGTPALAADRFYLVDPAGEIRASIAERDPALASELLDAAGALLRETRQKAGVAARGPFR